MRIVLGVTGSIAAYKACEIVRGLRKRGCSVTAALTRAAEEFITPLTLQALTGHRVIRSLFDDGLISSTSPWRGSAVSS